MEKMHFILSLIYLNNIDCSPVMNMNIPSGLHIRDDFECDRTQLANRDSGDETTDASLTLRLANDVFYSTSHLHTTGIKRVPYVSSTRSLGISHNPES
jgi:hypothetical protein